MPVLLIPYLHLCQPKTIFMKKLLTLFAFTLIMFISYQSQAQLFSEGNNVINLGVGFGGVYSYGYSATFSPSYNLSFEHGVKVLGPGTLGVGLKYSNISAKYNYTAGSYHYDYKWSNNIAALRVTYHPDFLAGDNWEVYGAADIGLWMWKEKYSTNDPYDTYDYNTSASSPVIYFQVGGRYYFTNAIGVFGELGYDVTYVKGGIAINL